GSAGILRRGRRAQEIFFFARAVRNELGEGPTLFSQQDLRAKLELLDPAMPVFSSELLLQFDRPVVPFPSPVRLARLAQESRRSFFPRALEPIYLREPHITVPK